MQIIIRKAKDEELIEIIKLQEANHFNIVKDKEKEGFVSIIYPIEILREINNKIGIIVAVSGSKIVGYELPLDLKNALKI